MGPVGKQAILVIDMKTKFYADKFRSYQCLKQCDEYGRLSVKETTAKDSSRDIAFNLLPDKTFCAMSEYLR